MPKDKGKRRITVTVDATQANALQVAKTEKSLNVSAFVRRAISNELAKEGEE